MTANDIHKAIEKLDTFRLGREDNYLLESVNTQLNFLITVIDDPASCNSKLKDINIGVIAVREIEGINDDLAEMLYEIDYWVKNKLL